MYGRVLLDHVLIAAQVDVAKVTRDTARLVFGIKYTMYFVLGGVWINMIDTMGTIWIYMSNKFKLSSTTPTFSTFKIQNPKVDNFIRTLFAPAWKALWKARPVFPCLTMRMLDGKADLWATLVVAHVRA